MGYPHVKWPSFENIHRQINNLSDELVIVTEKIDGCNLGVEIQDGNIVALHSRNVTIWHKDMSEPLNSDMSLQKNKLKFLRDDADKLKEFWTIYCSNPNMTVTLFGEVFKHKFYPFGFAKRHLDGSAPTKYYTMTIPVWDVLNTMGFTPPRLLISGVRPLSHAIETIHSEMMNPNKDFEGVFITFNDRSSFHYDSPFGLKYKTGIFEEQPAWNVDDTKIRPEFQDTVERMRAVYATKGKPEKVSGTGPAAKAKFRDEAIPIIALAWNSVLSKQVLSLSEMTKTELSKLIPSLIKETTADIQKTYDALTSEALAQALPIPTGAEISTFISKTIFSGS